MINDLEDLKAKYTAKFGKDKLGETLRASGGHPTAFAAALKSGLDNADQREAAWAAPAAPAGAPVIAKKDYGRPLKPVLTSLDQIDPAAVYAKMNRAKAHPARVPLVDDGGDGDEG